MPLLLMAACQGVGVEQTGKLSDECALVSSCKSSVPGLFRFPSSVMQAEYLRASSYLSHQTPPSEQDGCELGRR
eukprot:2393222-Amphidinium_carterae.1